MPGLGDFRGMDLTRALNRIGAWFAALAVNVRAYLKGGVQMRTALTSPLLTISFSPLTVSVQPSQVQSQGYGIPWVNPQAAVDSGQSLASEFAIAGYSVTDGVATFATTNQTLKAGDEVTLGNFQDTPSLWLNGLVVTVSATGLSSTSFEADVVSANLSSPDAVGTGVPVGGAATLSLPPAGVTPPDGSYSAYAYPIAGSVSGGAPGLQCCAPESGWYIWGGGEAGPGGVALAQSGGCSQTCSGSNLALVGKLTDFIAPSLPPGAVITAIYPVVAGEWYGGENGMSFSGTGFSDAPSWSGSSGSWVGASIGTDPSVLASAIFEATMGAQTVDEPAISNGIGVIAYFQIVYTLSSAPAAVQDLVATDCGLSIPTPSTILGVEVTLSVGAVSGTPGNLSVQLTIGGTPVGNPKTITPEAWAQQVSLGGPSDLWGAALTAALVNGSNGIGVTVTPAVPNSGDELAVNDIELSVTYEVPAGPIHSLRRLNDSTPSGPEQGYEIVVGAGGSLFVGTQEVASGMSGNPVSLIPFRPNSSPQPWMYTGDNSEGVTIYTEKAIDNSSASFECYGMLKARSDGRVYKSGIMEPQSAPDVSTSGNTTQGEVSLPATTIPWSNVSGQNPDYNYGQTDASDGTAPVIILTPAGSQTLTLTVTGSATVNGAAHAPGDAGPTGSSYPANFTGSGPKIVVGAFTDGTGNVLTGTSPVLLLANVGASITLQVPNGAVQFQIGIDSAANTFSANAGTFTVDWQLVQSAIATTISTMGQVTAYYWGDSPHSGPTASYIWKNPNDTGTGTPRTTSNAAGTVTNNSWEFDSSPEDGTVPVQWNTLNSDGTIAGSVPLFSPALESEGYQDFNACIVGNLWVPSAGTYEFTFVNKDQIMVGIGGGATVSGGYVSGPFGQTKSVVNALPLVYVSTPNGTGGKVFHTVSITFPASGSYQVEIDWDYWYHSGRCLYMLLGSFDSLPTPPTGVIPPLPSGVRTGVSYRAKYRSSPTGAVSNPSPPSNPQLTPVLDNTVSCAYSPDPQVDKVDYYRQDDTLENYTYVATGPNTNPPTQIVDSLSSTAAAANPTIDYDDFEPVPSIDLPRSGVCNVSGGVITTVSGDEFNPRWLAGTVIEIGSPTQIAYTLIARPTSTSSMTIPEVPDGENLVWNIAEPILANQPLPYLFGPTDNINYAFAVGDPLRPGTLYWSKGSNLDSWPDTNQLDVTDPSEPLVNGAMSGGLGVVFSIRRAWTIIPNFFNAEATATGTAGSTWTLQATAISRGLFIPRCLAVGGGGEIFFRVDDGVSVSIAGGAEKSITDDELYPLFSHEGSTPQPVTRNGVTIYPPDDNYPELQRFSVVKGYLYYDYQGTDSNWHTLVFDIAAMGWVWDTPAPAATVHGSNEGESVQGVLVGCVDSTVRLMANPGEESLSAAVLSPAIGGQGWQSCYLFTVEYSSESQITLTPIVVDEGNGSYAPAAVTLPSTGGQITKYTARFSPSKWKLLQFAFSWTDPAAQVFLEGFEVHCRNWGDAGDWRPVLPFSGDGGLGGQP